MSKIGRYEILDELGQGGMATVYLACDPYINRQVAIKVLSYELTEDPLFLEFFQREAEAVAALEHKAIVPIFDYGFYGRQPYIVMRQMTGGSLEDRLKDGPLKPRRIAAILQRVAEGLSAAHQKGIIHRDIKPSNILFDEHDQAYVADFGLAKLLSRPTGVTGQLFIGTPEYMSPEQVRGQELDGRSDTYALGIILYESLTGQLPYVAEDAMETAVLQITSPLPSILAHNPTLHPVWDEILRRTLAKQPTDRYPTPREFATDVSQTASGKWFMRKLLEN